MDEQVRKTIQSITDKIEHLNKTIKKPCWLCDKDVQNWICLYPKNSGDDLGYGVSGPNKARIAFIPVCEHHDIHDEEIIDRLQKLYIIKLQTLLN